MTSLRPGPREDTRTERIVGAEAAGHRGSWCAGSSFTTWTPVPCVQGQLSGLTPAPSPAPHAGSSRVLRAAPRPQFLQLRFHDFTLKINGHRCVLLLCPGLCPQGPETILCKSSVGEVTQASAGPGVGSRVGAGRGGRSGVLSNQSPLRAQGSVHPGLRGGMHWGSWPGLRRLSVCCWLRADAGGLMRADSASWPEVYLPSLPCPPPHTPPATPGRPGWPPPGADLTRRHVDGP